MNVSNYFLSSQSPAVASMSNSRSALNGRFIPTKLNTAFPPTRISKVPFLGLHVWSLSFLAQLSHPGLIAMAPWSCPRIAWILAADRLNTPHDLQASITILVLACMFLLLLLVWVFAFGILCGRRCGWGADGTADNNNKEQGWNDCGFFVERRELPLLYTTGWKLIFRCAWHPASEITR